MDLPDRVRPHNRPLVGRPCTWSDATTSRSDRVFAPPPLSAFATSFSRIGAPGGLRDPPRGDAKPERLRVGTRIRYAYTGRQSTTSNDSRKSWSCCHLDQQTRFSERRSHVDSGK